jgi:hypothetical protein
LTYFPVTGKILLLIKRYSKYGYGLRYQQRAARRPGPNSPPGTKVRFIERENEILLQPVTKEYIQSVCGLLKSGTSVTQALLKERTKDKKREEAKVARFRAR